jgi:hypothetical protein
VTERQAKWAVQGVASGTPMGAAAAAEVLNELLASDPAGTAQLVEAGPGLLGVVNGILRREDPHGSGVAAVRDDWGWLLGFCPVHLS